MPFSDFTDCLRYCEKNQSSLRTLFTRSRAMRRVARRFEGLPMMMGDNLFDRPPTPAPGEFTDRQGAELLKARIESYWRERGYDVQITLVQAAFTAALRASRYDLRSEMTNGLPRKTFGILKHAPHQDCAALLHGGTWANRSP